MKTAIVSLLCALAAPSGPLLAELAKIDNETEFRQAVEGKILTRPLVRLSVLSDGRITGTGARWDVTGAWKWEGGYFCRKLEWGGSDLGYNCQEVRADAGRIRFTSDRGLGASAEFRLRK